MSKEKFLKIATIGMIILMYVMLIINVIFIKSYNFSMFLLGFVVCNMLVDIINFICDEIEFNKKMKAYENKIKELKKIAEKSNDKAKKKLDK